MTIAGIALIGLIIGADTFEGWQDYLRVMGDNERLQVALGRAVTEQTARMVQEIDIALSSIADWPQGGADAVLQRALARIGRLPFVESAWVVGADGQPLADTRSQFQSPGGADPNFLAQLERTAKDSLYIEGPRSDEGGACAFAVGRRSMPGGSIAAAGARISCAYIADFYREINVNANTSILLMRDDGVVLARFPGRPDANSHDLVRRTQSRGGARIEVADTVPGYPLVVVVSRARSDVLKPWIQEERSSAARTLSLSLLAAILLVGLRSALERRQKGDEERHRLEHELAAVERVEALGFLAASVAHDFNNVLTAIVGYAELARETAGSVCESHIDRLLAATERARLLVRRVLTFDPRRSLSYRATRIEPILREVVQHVAATLPPSITLTLQGMDQPATILGDPTEIYQVVMNLCSNGIHAMPAGGSLQIRCESLEKTEPQVLALGRLQAGRWVCLSVIDTGVGLADEQVASIFEPFYTTRQPGLGTGIGLTVVRNIILRMNGALDVSSHLGQGTRMSVYWPAIEAPMDPTRSRLANDGAGQTIMVVDDEKELVTLTEELLASLSYEPVGYSDSRLALQAFLHDPSRFDAVLTDERMQPLRGLDFAAHIHELKPGLPIILMTGHRDAELDARANLAGIAEILDKPLRVQVLREALARHLRPGINSSASWSHD